MGCDSVYHAGIRLGFLIKSDEVLNLKDYSTEYCLDPEQTDPIIQKLGESFNKFLKKKFDESISESFSAMEFTMFYSKVLATYDVKPYGYPLLSFGYDLYQLHNEPKNLNSIGDVNFTCNFPPNCLDILAEFYAETKIKQDRKNKKTKKSKSDESDEESSDEALPEDEVEKFKKMFVKKISYSLKSAVSSYPLDYDDDL